MNVIAGTQGYAEEAEVLLRRYENIKLEDIHKDFLKFLPDPPAQVLDIGCGTGRDAAALAGLGYDVVAVEPVDELRDWASTSHASPRITWINDHLPELEEVAGLHYAFDLILMTAVWMHMDKPQRSSAMPVIAGMLKPGGRLMITTRHGPVPEGRQMFEVSADETINLVRKCGLNEIHVLERQPDKSKHPEVFWTRMAFEKK